MTISAHETPITGKTVEWGTPPHVPLALGPFDLDGTTQGFFAPPWPRESFVFLNPPYGRDIGVWMQRLAAHGNGIALVYARTDTAWWHEYVAKRATAVMFLRGRLSFIPLNGQHTSSNSGAPSALIGYGDLAKQRLEKCSLEGWLVAV